MEIKNPLGKFVKTETIDEIMENTRRIQDNTIFHIRQVIET